MHPRPDHAVGQFDCKARKVGNSGVTLIFTSAFTCSVCISNVSRPKVHLFIVHPSYNYRPCRHGVQSHPRAYRRAARATTVAHLHISSFLFTFIFYVYFSYSFYIDDSRTTATPLPDDSEESSVGPDGGRTEAPRRSSTRTRRTRG